jgi:serine/threonine-protein kinase
MEDKMKRLAMIFVVFFLISFAALAAAQQESVVPNVVGMDIAAAQKTLGQQHLNAIISWQETNRASQQNKILKQNPPAGQKVKYGTGIQLTAARYVAAPQESVVPNIVGMNYTQSTQVITQAGLQIFDFGCAYDNPAMKDKVAHQYPNAGTKVKKGTYVGRAFYAYQAAAGVKPQQCVADPNRMPKQ